MTGPMGSFELIVTKALELPKWKRDGNFDPEGPQFGGPEFGESTSVDDQLQLQLQSAERPIFSFALSNYIIDFFRTMWTNRKVTSVRIRAVNWNPPVESYVWTTPKGSADRVLEEIAEGLAQGKIVQPVGAVFSGDEKRN